MTQHSISSRRDGLVLCSLGRPGPYVHFSLKEFGKAAVTCEDCLERIAARQAIHDRLNAPRTTPTLLDQIKAGMLRRNPRLADPEWATEDYRPLRNRR